MDERNFDFKAPNGVPYDSPESWLFEGILGGCGCGYSEELAELAYKLLKYFGTPHMERDSTFYYGDDDGLTNEILAHWFYDKELIEHGTSIGGSWLTDKGKKILKQIESYKNEKTTE